MLAQVLDAGEVSLLQAWVGFRPARFVLDGVFTLVKTADVCKKAVVLERARADFCAVVVVAPAGARFVRSRVRDHKDQGLPAALGTGAQHFDDAVCFVFVDLVNQGNVRRGPD